jgi:hypothetical protein
MSNDVYPSPFRGLAFTVTKTPQFSNILQSSASLAEVTIAQTANPVWAWQLVYEVLFNDARSTAGFSPYTDLQELMGFFLKQQGRFSNFLYLDPDDNAVGPAISSNGANLAPAATGTPSATAALQLVNDGAGNYYTPLQRNLGGQFYEDVTDLNAAGTYGGAAQAIYVNGALAKGYLVAGPGLAIPGHSFGGLYVPWAWRAGHAYALGDTIIDPAGHLQKATTAGTSGGTIPTFNDAGSTTPDGVGTLVWTDQGAAAGVTGQFSFYFRVRFDADQQDFEKFVYNLWTIGGSEGRNGSGSLKLVTSRVPLI